MDTSLFFPLGEGLELTQMERQEGQLVLHATAPSSSALCPLCQQPATRLHSRYRRVVKDLPCAGQQMQLILYVRKFFCDTADCVRKVFTERLPQLVAPWAQMTTRLNEALQTTGLATCGRLAARYQQAVLLREQGCSVKQIACQLGASERTVRHWFERGVAADTRPRRKRQSDFDPYAAYVLKRWQDGEHNGTRLWEEIAARGYPGSQRMVYRFLKTLKKTEVKPTAETLQIIRSSSTAAVCLFMRHPDNLDESERMGLAALRQAHSDLETAYDLTQDFLQMLRKREGERLDTWRALVQESGLPELASFAHGVELDQAAVQAGLTLPIKNGQTEGHVTRMKLIKRMMYGKAGFALLRQRVLHRL